MRILVTASNEYVHCLPAFAYLFNRHVDAEQPVTVLRYDVRPPALPQNFGQFAVGAQAEYSWSEGLMRYLTWLRNEDPLERYVLLLCEDYFIRGPVDRIGLSEAYDRMDAQEELAKFDLSGDLAKRTGISINPDTGIVVAGDDTPWQASIQAAIWRIDFLLDILVAGETPWQFEKKGTKRIIAAHKERDFRIMGTAVPILHYVNAVGGEGKKPGAYDHKKIPAELWDELKEKGLVKE